MLTHADMTAWVEIQGGLDRASEREFEARVWLQRFRGELVMLGDKGERQEPARAIADLDDEIPF